jgi:hypothetical protein
VQQNPELVGFLLHPISRSETWRRLIVLQARSSLTPGAERETGTDLLGGRVDRRKQKQRIDNCESIPDLARFLKEEKSFEMSLTCVFSIIYVGVWVIPEYTKGTAQRSRIVFKLEVTNTDSRQRYLRCASA